MFKTNQLMDVAELRVNTKFSYCKDHTLMPQLLLFSLI